MGIRTHQWKRRWVFIVKLGGVDCGREKADEGLALDQVTYRCFIGHGSGVPSCPSPWKPAFPPQGRRRELLLPQLLMEVKGFLPLPIASAPVGEWDKDPGK